MGWLRRLAGISRRQRKKNDDIRLELTQMDTLVEKIQRRRLQWFDHVKRMNNSRLPAKALETLISGTRSQGRQNKRWIDNIKEDLQQRGRDATYRQQNVSQRQEAMEEICPCSPIVGNLRVKTDGSKKRKKEIDPSLAIGLAPFSDMVLGSKVKGQG